MTIAEAKAKRAFLEQQLADAKAKALANITPEADEVLAALAEGQDWDTLAEAHNDDPGMKAGAANAAFENLLMTSVLSAPPGGGAELRPPFDRPGLNDAPAGRSPGVHQETTVQGSWTNRNRGITMVETGGCGR